MCVYLVDSCSRCLWLRSFSCSRSKVGKTKDDERRAARWWVSMLSLFILGATTLDNRRRCCQTSDKSFNEQRISPIDALINYSCVILFNDATSDNSHRLVSAPSSFHKARPLQALKAIIVPQCRLNYSTKAEESGENFTRSALLLLASLHVNVETTRTWNSSVVALGLGWGISENSIAYPCFFLPFVFPH